MRDAVSNYVEVTDDRVMTVKLQLMEGSSTAESQMDYSIPCSLFLLVI